MAEGEERSEDVARLVLQSAARQQGVVEDGVVEDGDYLHVLWKKSTSLTSAPVKTKRWNSLQASRIIY